MLDVATVLGVIAMFCSGQANVCTTGIPLQEVSAAIAQVGQQQSLKNWDRPASAREEVLVSNSGKLAASGRRRSAKEKIQIPVIIGVYF